MTSEELAAANERLELEVHGFRTNCHRHRAELREARVEVDRLAAALTQIREVRSCLGAGPMDYEAFVDEIDRILAEWRP